MAAAMSRVHTAHCAPVWRQIEQKILIRDQRDSYWAPGVNSAQYNVSRLLLVLFLCGGDVRN